MVSGMVRGQQKGGGTFRFRRREIEGRLFEADEVAEAGLELLGGQVDDGTEFGELLGMFEVFAFEADHIGQGAFIGFAINVDLAVLHAAGLGVEHVVEGERVHLAIDETDDGAEFFSGGGEEEFDGGVAEVAGVFGIEGDGVSAAEFVAEVLVDEGHVDAEFVEALGEELLH